MTNLSTLNTVRKLSPEIMNLSRSINFRNRKFYLNCIFWCNELMLSLPYKFVVPYEILIFTRIYVMTLSRPSHHKPPYELTQYPSYLLTHKHTCIFINGLYAIDIHSYGTSTYLDICTLQVMAVIVSTSDVCSSFFHAMLIILISAQKLWWLPMSDCWRSMANCTRSLLSMCRGWRILS